MFTTSNITLQIYTATQFQFAVAQGTLLGGVFCETFFQKGAHASWFSVWRACSEIPQF